MRAKIAVCILALAAMGLAHDEGKGKPVKKGGMAGLTIKTIEAAQ
ncbi:MAG TPA: hypothetical protein VMT86_12105 [Bryobacteraceae bacterium]|nr:hypothetical protein [Bryobacteraceae bacterium]